MADTKISALTGVASVAGTNEFAVNEAGTSKKATATQIQTFTNSAADLVKTGQANTYSTGAQDFASATSLALPTANGTAEGHVDIDQARDNFFGYDAISGRGSFVRTVPIDPTFSTTDSIVDDTVAGVETAFAQTCTLPANFFLANKVLHVTYIYEYTTGASPPTLLLSLRLASASGTQLYVPTAFTPAASLTRSFGLHLYIQGTAAPGASTSLEIGAIGFLGGTATSTYNTVAQPVAAIATNGSLVLVPTAQWGSNAANTHTVRLRQAIYEAMN